MANETLTHSQILQMQARERYEKSKVPRIKSVELLAQIIEFVNSGKAEMLLPAKYAGKEQQVKKQIDSHKELGGVVWPLTNEDGLYLVNITPTPTTA